jgi:hypothetical protein
LILGGPAVLEALVAAGLWGTLLTVACGLTVREAQAGARPEDTPGDPELHG